MLLCSYFQNILNWGGGCAPFNAQPRGYVPYYSLPHYWVHTKWMTGHALMWKEGYPICQIKTSLRTFSVLIPGTRSLVDVARMYKSN